MLALACTTVMNRLPDLLLIAAAEKRQIAEGLIGGWRGRSGHNLPTSGRKILYGNGNRPFWVVRQFYSGPYFEHGLRT